MKTFEELRDLATRWALDHISYHQAQSRVNLAGIGSGLAIAQRFEEESKRALDDALRELIADAGQLQFIRAHYSGLMCTTNRGEVSVTFQPALEQSMIFTPDLLDDAIDAARKG